MGGVFFKGGRGGSGFAVTQYYRRYSTYCLFAFNWPPRRRASPLANSVILLGIIIGDFCFPSAEPHAAQSTLPYVQTRDLTVGHWPRFALHLKQTRGFVRRALPGSRDTVYSSIDSISRSTTTTVVQHAYAAPLLSRLEIHVNLLPRLLPFYPNCADCLSLTPQKVSSNAASTSTTPPTSPPGCSHRDTTSSRAYSRR